MSPLQEQVLAHRSAWRHRHSGAGLVWKVPWLLSDSEKYRDRGKMVSASAPFSSIILFPEPFYLYITVRINFIATVFPKCVGMVDEFSRENNSSLY